MTGTQYFTDGRPFSEQEAMFRFLAREPRTRRRLLATSLHEVLERSTHSHSPWDARVLKPSNSGDPHYVFLFVKRKPNLSDEEYRNSRINLLSDYCHVVKLRWPEAMHIVGIASEAGDTPRRSEDLMYLDVSDWSSELETKTREIQNRLGLLREVKPHRTRVHEYPVDHTGKPLRTAPSRNSPCPCGSGKRFKRCHGKELSDGKHSRK
jgi:SEC-C motif